MYDALKFYLEENKSEATIILDKMSKSKFAREAARKAREEARAGKSKRDEKRSLSDKLTPPQSRNPKSMNYLSLKVNQLEEPLNLVVTENSKEFYL